MENRYNPHDVEDRIYGEWETKGAFKPTIDKSKKPFCIVIPPPNVTGQLHMGHALDETVQDIFVRYHRMNGEPTLWIPGTDHASIATEVKVVAKLLEEGKTKESLGREGFLEEAWKWKEKYGDRIQQQLRKLGASCDWSRERFTMDEGLSKAVEYVFVELYNKGYIYKGERIVNWCPSCHTSISDNEVEYVEEASHLWHIKYELEDGTGSVVVATTRPETMLGDTAVAVNPSDSRYEKMIGKTLILPLMNTRIPVIADDYVEKDFGTGAVKITPAHDPNDYLVGKRHKLDLIKVIGEDGKILNGFGKYSNLDRSEARQVIVEDLKQLGALVQNENYTHNVGHCYRCHSTIEPYASSQWFVKMEELAKPAIQAVQNKEVNFIPKRFEKIYFNWMENIQDWCISRQLWWGHRIPAYYCSKCGKMEVTLKVKSECECGGTYIQDEDVLDTWFSSALWPFSTLGWPNKTEEFEYFYPTTLLVTGYDIITFWVSKMIFSAIEHTGKVPFKDVFIHGLVRDSQGRKMSKSLGNGIDPLEIISKYGTDALRFSLVQGIAPGNDIRFIEEKVEAGRNFANKLYNAARFIDTYLKKSTIVVDKVDESKLKLEDKWIISKFSKCVDSVTKNIDNFEIGIALNEIYDFTWKSFCDVYIEMVKPRLYLAETEEYIVALSTVKYVFEGILKLLHPYMPFVTEEIYQNVIKPNNSNVEFLMLSSWPSNIPMYVEEENIVDEVNGLLVMVRNALATKGITKKVNAVIDTNILKISEMLTTIQKLGKIEQVAFEKIDSLNNDDLILHTANIAIGIDISDVVDKEQQKQKNAEELNNAMFELNRAKTMLANEKFVAKAPREKIEEEKAKIEKYTALIEKLQKQV